MRLHNVPLPRVSIDDSNPYKTGGYTQAQLDMRRKVEILKYNANKSSSQTNMLTRKERYALAMRGGFRTPSAQPQIPAEADANCPDDYVLTPTTACNIPGPVIYLREDPAVPLYNYSITNTRTYPDYVPPDNRQWRIVAATDASFIPLREDILFTLLIYREIENNFTTYDITFPVGLDVSGMCISNTPKPANFTVSINYVVMTIYFGGNVVSRTQSPALGSTLNMTFNVADKPNGGAFKMRNAIGNVSFPGIQLNTIYNYVYQFNFMFSVSLRADDPDYSAVNYWVGGI
jgi:hypothetical protein